MAATLGTAGTASAPVPARDMVPTYATAPPQRAATNLLSDIDRAAQAVIGESSEDLQMHRLLLLRDDDTDIGSCV